MLQKANGVPRCRRCPRRRRRGANFRRAEFCDTREPTMRRALAVLATAAALAPDARRAVAAARAAAGVVDVRPLGPALEPYGSERLERVAPRVAVAAF